MPLYSIEKDVTSLKIIKPYAYPIYDNKNISQKIEICGRTCYRSEDKITDTSSVKFVQNMIKHKHTAMLEHATLYLRINKIPARMMKMWLTEIKFGTKYDNITPYINMTTVGDNTYFSCSLRTMLAIFERYFETYCSTGVSNSGIEAVYKIVTNKYPDIFNRETMNFELNISPRTEKIILFENPSDFIRDIKAYIENKNDANNAIMKHVTHSIAFICDRGVTHEFVRHRPASFAQESTRYCNYTKDKFDNEITVIEPFFYKDREKEYDAWFNSCETAEKEYFKLIENGSTPQEARSVLPNSLKTQLIITATESEWQHIVNLRYKGSTGSPHPQIKEVMESAMPFLKEMSEYRIS